MSLSAERPIVGTTRVAVATNPAFPAVRVMLRNQTGTGTVYLGGPDVTTADGYAWEPSQGPMPWTLDLGETLYAIVSGASQTLHVLAGVWTRRDEEGLVFDGLDLNPDDGGLYLEQLRNPPPKKRPEWQQGADADGSMLVRDPLLENREITLRLRVNPTATMNDALDQIAAVSQKIEEAERNLDGLELVWTPARSTRPVTFYVLTGSVDDVPIEAVGDGAGWFADRPAPVITVTLTCKPYGYEDQVTYPSDAPQPVTSPFATLDVPDVRGDAPAQAELVVTNEWLAALRWVEWGLEQRWHDPDDPTVLAFAGDDLSVTDTAGTIVGDEVHATLFSTPQPVAQTGTLEHVGTFRVYALVIAEPTSDPYSGSIRLRWHVGDNDATANPYTTLPFPGSSAPSVVDLGLVNIPQAQSGAQGWTGIIDAYGVTTDLRILGMRLVPAGEGYGLARAPVETSAPARALASDAFGGTSVTMDGRTGDFGGAWNTTFPGGDLDFQVGSSAASRLEDEVGTAFATLGPALTNTRVSARVFGNQTVFSGEVRSGLLARFVDTSNWIAAVVHRTDVSERTLVLLQCLAGTITELASSAFTADGNFQDLVITVDASGAIVAELRSSVTGNLLASVAVAAIGAAMTGGALEDGMAGLYDEVLATTTDVRGWGAFIAASPESASVVAHIDRTIEFRHDSVERQTADGATYGRPPSYRGGPFALPPAGDNGRTSRVVVHADTADLHSTPTGLDGASGTILGLQVRYRPRWIVVPGA